MDTVSIDINKRYSYADYMKWTDDVRRELFEGVIKLMTPSPSLKHQRTSRNLVAEINKHLIGQRCEYLFSPSDVRFPKENKRSSDKDIYTVVQPDIYIVCDLSKLDERGCLGPPDLIIEIVSAQNSKRDVKEKFDLYEKYGVKEYWIVNPNDENINVFFRDVHGKYQFVGLYAGDDKIPLNIFNGEIAVDLSNVFTGEGP